MIYENIEGAKNETTTCDECKFNYKRMEQFLFSSTQARLQLAPKVYKNISFSLNYRHSICFPWQGVYLKPNENTKNPEI